MADLNNAVERVLQGAVSKVLSKMKKNEASSEEEFEPSLPKKLKQRCSILLSCKHVCN